MQDRTVLRQNLNGEKKKPDCIEIVPTEIISVLTVLCLVLENVNPFVQHLGAPLAGLQMLHFGTQVYLCKIGWNCR